MKGVTLFYPASSNKKSFSEVLKEVQEYLSGKYATLISRNAEEQKQQIISYTTKYVMDYRLSVDGLSFDELVERLYAEMAEFSFLTPYLFSHDVEEININGYKDVKITYTD